MIFLKNVVFYMFVPDNLSMIVVSEPCSTLLRLFSLDQRSFDIFTELKRDRIDGKRDFYHIAGTAQ